MQIKKKCIVQAALDGEMDFMVIGCNCFSTWGAGLNKLVKHKLPTAFTADECNWMEPCEKIGGYTYSYHENPDGSDFYVINAYTQYDFGTDYRRFEYGAWKLFLQVFQKDFVLDKKRIGIPKIGCGLGGADWEIVKTIMKDYLDETNITVYEP